MSETKDPEGGAVADAPTTETETPEELARVGAPQEAVADAPTTDSETPEEPARVGAPREAVEGEAPRKRKKRKRKPVQSSASGSFERPELDARGAERPRFLLRFPQDEALEPLITAFERGDYARVRVDAVQLIERTDRVEVKRAAEELLRRIEPDPLVKFLLGVAVALFVAVVAYVYYAHG